MRSDAQPVVMVPRDEYRRLKAIETAAAKLGEQMDVSDVRTSLRDLKKALEQKGQS